MCEAKWRKLHYFHNKISPQREDEQSHLYNENLTLLWEYNLIIL